MNSIQLCDKYKCTQCMACVNTCTKGCITMVDAGEGFLVPEIDRDICTECGACMRSCHRLVPIVKNGFPLHTLACWTTNDSYRRKSSSGGAFSVLADHVISHGGVVFGATMDKDLRVKHIFIDKIEDIYILQGSKYVQSFLGDTYKQVRDMLVAGRLVLFTGTPCQIGGLLAFLHKKFENLITADLVCHGVPSQGSFDAFCARTEIAGTCDRVSFRFTEGWGFQLSLEYFTKAKLNDSHLAHIVRKPINPHRAWYMRAFDKGLMFNEACYDCTYAVPQRVSDFTMADYWGLGSIAPFNHPCSKGVSMLLVNNERAWEIIKECKDFFYEERLLEEAIVGNHNLSHPSFRPKGRDSFIDDMTSMEQSELMKKYDIRGTSRDYLRLLKQWIISKKK